jgi:hypothetical protein
MASNIPDKLLPTRAVRARYDDICDRTVDRWVEAGELPQPVYIRRRRYWSAEALDARDRERAAARVATGAEDVTFHPIGVAAKRVVNRLAE